MPRSGRLQLGWMLANLRTNTSAPATVGVTLTDSGSAFGIARSTQGMNGWDAMRLWERYENEGDRAALDVLLEYNREDVINLMQLERIVVGVGLELEKRATSHEPRAES